MFQLEDSTIAFLCFLAFLIVAPLIVLGVFALSEAVQSLFRSKRRRLRPLRLAVRRCSPARAAAHAGDRAGTKSTGKAATREMDSVI